MHPVLARFLPPDELRNALLKYARGEPLDAEEALAAKAGDAFPEARDALVEKPEEEADPGELEQTVLLLGIHASRLAIEEDPELAAAADAARAALEREGATAENANEMIASILLEEAFGYDDEADDFDRAFVLASMGEIPQLAELTPEGVHSLHDRFVSAGDKQDVREKVLSALLEVAWGDGPAAINPEHIEEAWAKVSRGVRSAATREERRVVMEEALELLAALELVSELRAERLRRKLTAVSGG